MSQPTAKVIADSISPDGHRLATMEISIHRFVLSEFNTHRAFSRNSASSRAIPYVKMRSMVLNDPAVPLSWPKEQKGMQGGDQLSEVEQITCELHWLNARDSAVESADKLRAIGLHKSVVNRLLEPFMWHRVIVSATDWEGFWAQRCHPDAQPEIRVAAEAMKKAYDSSTPEKLQWGQFHVPYVSEEECKEFPIKENSSKVDVTPPRLGSLLKISAARCARVSYLTHDGQRDPYKDIELFERLAYHTPPHASPLEHVAKAAPYPVRGNFQGFEQLRHIMGMK